MRKYILGIVAAGFIFGLAGFAHADKGVVSGTVYEVKVEGNKQLSRNAVLSYVKCRPGMEYSDKLVKADRDRMMSSGRFESVNVSRKFTNKGVVVIFSIVERPGIDRLVISGMKAFSEEELRKVLPFGQGDSLNPALIEQGRVALLSKYQNDGYYLAKVEVNKVRKGDGYQVIYTIEEGPQTIITKVRFDGNHYFSSVSLKLKTQTKAKLWPFIKGYLNKEKIERDVNGLRNSYVQEGFLDAEVAYELEFSDDKSKVTVVFNIKEGPRYRVNKIIFRGNKVYSSADLERRIGFHQGSFFTTEGLRFDIKSIEAAYGEIGYIDARVEFKKNFLPPDAKTPAWATDLDGGKPTLLNVIFNIDEQDQYKIAAIRIQGNTVTQERVIRRELNFLPNQLCDTVAIERSKSKLQELRLFGKVNITPVAVVDPADPKKYISGKKDVVIDVEEGKTADFVVGVGVSTNSGLLGTVSLTERNFDAFNWPKSMQDLVKSRSFKGAGQTLQISAEPGSELMRFTVSWFTPYINDQPYSFGSKAYFFTREYEHYDEERLGAQVSVGHRFKNLWYGEFATKIENVQMNVDSDAAQEIWDDRGSHNLVSFRGSLVRDRTDSRWNPSKGDRFNFSYEQFVGDYNFGRFNAGYRIYRTLYVDQLDRKHILAARMSYGQIAGDAPVFERFYGGGIGSIRGFEYRGISPRGHYRDTNEPKDNDPIGGDMMFFAGVEYQFPLITEALRGVVFLDSGTVEKDFDMSAYRVSVGFGFRWTIPFFGPVPLALDFGFPLAKQEEDDTQLVNFTLGWSF